MENILDYVNFHYVQFLYQLSLESRNTFKIVVFQGFPCQRYSNFQKYFSYEYNIDAINIITILHCNINNFTLFNHKSFHQ